MRQTGSVVNPASRPGRPGRPSRPGRSDQRRSLLLTVLLALALAVVAAATGQPAAAQATLPAVDWERTGLVDPVNRLIGAPDGTLYAVTPDGVLRSQGGAQTWTPVPVPEDVRLLVVDPVDASVLYVWSPSGLHKSEDGAATWRAIYSQEPPVRFASGVLTVSPADHDLLYLAVVVNPSTPSGSYRLLRSNDGGATWEEIGRGGPGQSCNYEFPILQAHPTDANRVFRTSGCTASRDFQYGLSMTETADRGATWTPSFTERGQFPMVVVGGRGASPDRLYLLTVSRRIDVASASTTLYRSEAGGPWTAVHRWCCADSGAVRLLYEPEQPDRVYVIPQRGGIKASLDGGETWTEPGERGLVDVRDMAISRDGGSLFAATGRGVFRLPLR